MPRPTPLPDPLNSTPFTIATARERGVSPRRLRAQDLDRSFWGLRAATPQTSVLERCALLQLRMPPESYFSHGTAALIHGMPVPRFVEADPTLHVSVRAPARAPHASGLRGHRSSAPETPVTRHGVRVSTIERTWCDLATQLSIPNLVAAGDFAIHHRSPLTSRERLELAVHTGTNRRGLRRLVAALPRLDSRSESPQESKLRLILCDAGMPPSRVNHVVNDAFGEFVARTDFFLDELNVILEYQGDYHRTTPGQWRADMTRRARIEAHGPRVMELNADDLKDPVELVSRVWALAAIALR